MFSHTLPLHPALLSLSLACSLDTLAVASARGPSFALAHCPDTFLSDYVDLCSESIQWCLGLRMKTRTQPHPFRETGMASAAVAGWFHFAHQLTESGCLEHSLEKNSDPTARARLAESARACEWGVVVSWRKVCYWEECISHS